MLLAIDIGNTNITFGVFDGEKLVATWRMATDTNKMPDEYAIAMIDMLRHEGLETSDITSITMCSTVPPLNTIFEELFKRYFGITPLIVSPGVRTGVHIRMDNPREVGPDRIANAAAAHHLYEGPVIVVDVGTATTFDVVSSEGDFLGGVVAPGIAGAADALFTRTAALPRIELVAPTQAIGSNTISAMQAGVIFGYAGLIEGILARIQKQLGEKAKVVATGGYARLIVSETPSIDLVNPDITLVGLRQIYLMQPDSP